MQIVAADLHGSGLEDLFALWASIYETTHVTRFQNLGNGTLVAGEIWNAGNANGIAVGTLNGRPSVFIPELSYAADNIAGNMLAIVSESGSLSLVTGSSTVEGTSWVAAAPDGTLVAGNGTAIQVFDTAGSAPTAVAVQTVPNYFGGEEQGIAVDVNGDGKADIVSSGENALGTAAVFVGINGGNNSFSFTSYPVMPGIRNTAAIAVAAGRIYGSNAPGVYAIGVGVWTAGPPGANADPFILQVASNGALNPGVTIYNEGSEPRADLKFASLSGPGVVGFDALLTTSNAAYGGVDSIQVSICNGDGTFQNALEISPTIPKSPVSLAVIKNLGGRPAVAVQGVTGITVYTVTGCFQPSF